MVNYLFILLFLARPLKYIIGGDGPRRRHTGNNGYLALHKHLDAQSHILKYLESAPFHIHNHAQLIHPAEPFDIKQRRYFSREVSSLFLSRVQDVTTDVNGILSSLLDIGDITVQSAGEEREFIMHGISKPERMRDLILRYVPDQEPTPPKRD